MQDLILIENLQPRTHAAERSPFIVLPETKTVTRKVLAIIFAVHLGRVPMLLAVTAVLTGLGEKEPDERSAEARAWAEKQGLIQGDENGKKKYKQFCTREQMVVFLKRLADKIGG